MFYEDVTPQITVIGSALAITTSTSVFAADVRLKLAGAYPVAHFGHEIMETMVKEIEDAGVGVKIKYFPAAQLGSGEELIEDAIRGNIDMVQAFIYAQADPRLEIMNVRHVNNGNAASITLYLFRD